MIYHNKDLYLYSHKHKDMINGNKIPKLKLIKVAEYTIADKETGEIMDKGIHTRDVLTCEEDFVLAYDMFFMAMVKSTLYKCDMELLFALIIKYGDGNYFTVTALIRDELSTISGRSANSYNSSIRRLVEQNFIISKGSRSYIINPMYVFKGTTTQRKAIINKNK